MSEATVIAHWPGKDTAACDEHLKKLVGLAAVLGIQLSWTPVNDDTLTECANCATEAKKAQQ